MAKMIVVAVMICCSLLFGACNNEKSRGGIDEGSVYGVNFITGVEGLSIDAQVVSEGEKVIEPDVPLRSGYRFVGWSVDGVFWNFSSNRVFSSFELVAVWEKDEDSWAYTNGLEFEYNATTKMYDVVGYNGTDTTVNLPLYYSGTDGGHLVGMIADSAFAGNSTIKKIVLSSSVGASSFAGSAIEEVEFTNSVVSIGASAFSGTTNLKSVVFSGDDGNVVIGASSFAGSGIESIILPDSLTEIGASSFAGSSISSVKFGSLSRLKTIGASAFYNTNLVRISLPSGVETIGDGAFSFNTKLKNIIFPSGLKNIGQKIFEGSTALAGIYFTGSSKSKALTECAYWNPSGINEYFYSEYDKGVAGCWRGVDAFGDPVLYTKKVDYTLDFNAISDYLPNGLDGYKVVVKAYYVRVAGVYASDTQVLYFGNNFSTVAVLDQYKITSYSIEIFNSDDMAMELEGVVLSLYDLKVNQTHVIATGVNSETKTIII